MEATSEKSTSAAILAKAGKLQVADHARLMADNQQTLDQVNEQDRQARDLQGRIEEALAKAEHGANLADSELPQTGEDKDVQILIDSPVTLQNAPQEPPATARTSMSGLKKIALAAALLGTGGGIGAAVPLVIDALKPAAAATVPADSDTLYELHIGGSRD